MEAAGENAKKATGWPFRGRPIFTELDLISATDGSGVQEYYLTDGLGSTTDLRDEDGDAVADYTYDVFGAILDQSGSSPNEFTFTGEQRDSDSGMYFLRARYYDSATGRFLGQDPLPAQNLYAYVANNPVNRIDPSGLCWVGINCPGDPYDRGSWPRKDKEGGSFGSPSRPGPVPSTGPRYRVCSQGQCTYTDSLPYPIPCAGPRPGTSTLHCSIGDSSGGGDWYDPFTDLLGGIIDLTINPVVQEIVRGAAGFGECIAAVVAVGGDVLIYTFVDSAGVTALVVAGGCVGYAIVSPPGFNLGQ